MAEPYSYKVASEYLLVFFAYIYISLQLGGHSNIRKTSISIMITIYIFLLLPRTKEDKQKEERFMLTI